MSVSRIWVEFFVREDRIRDQSGPAEASDQVGCGGDVERDFVLFECGEELGEFFGRVIGCELEDSLEGRGERVRVRWRWRGGSDVFEEFEGFGGGGEAAGHLVEGGRRERVGGVREEGKE